MRTTLVPVLVLVALVAATSGHLYGYGYGVPSRGLVGGNSFTNQIYPIPYGHGYHHHHLIMKRSAEPDPKPQKDNTIFGTGLTRDRGALYGNQGVYSLVGPTGYLNPGGVYTIVGTNGYIDPYGNTGLYGGTGNTGLFGTNTGIYPTTGYDYSNFYPFFSVGSYPSFGNTYIPYNYGGGWNG